jgi:hypothetical protein
LGFWRRREVRDSDIRGARQQPNQRLIDHGKVECIQRPVAASGLQTQRSLCHEPAKLLRLKSIGLHLRLCMAALNGEHILNVLGIGKLASATDLGEVESVSRTLDLLNDCVDRVIRDRVFDANGYPYGADAWMEGQLGAEWWKAGLGVRGFGGLKAKGGRECPPSPRSKGQCPRVVIPPDETKRE